jgi:hypothetical protein
MDSGSGALGAGMGIDSVATASSSVSSWERVSSLMGGLWCRVQLQMSPLRRLAPPVEDTLQPRREVRLWGDGTSEAGL